MAGIKIQVLNEFLEIWLTISKLTNKSKCVTFFTFFWGGKYRTNKGRSSFKWKLHSYSFTIIFDGVATVQFQQTHYCLENGVEQKNQIQIFKLRQRKVIF